MTKSNRTSEQYKKKAENCDSKSRLLSQGENDIASSESK